jgi:hypothetical protein
MADLWQAYGTWIMYGALVLAMLWMHGGLGRRGRQGADHGHDPSDGHGHPQDPAAEASTSAATPGERGGHTHGRGCC